MKKVFVVSLGCPKNTVDSERVIWSLHNAGMEITTDESLADVLLVNTCGFVHDAKEESIDTILELAEIKKMRPDVKLAVMGCLSQRYRESLAESIPEIDFLYGTAELDRILADMAPTAMGGFPDPDTAPRLITTAPHWAYLKIAEGCSNKCAFCIIPSIRGPYRSFEKDNLLDETRTLVDSGVKEVILVAQDTTLYGADLKMKNGLAKLLRDMVKIDGLEWIRVMYMYPALINSELLSVMAEEPKIAPYFDIPLQHASTPTLQRMTRPETEKSIRELVDTIRTKIPGAAIRSSFIVGFPGETEKDFETLMRFIEDARLDHVGAFKYSPEEGTAAFDMPDVVDETVAENRLAELMETQMEISASILEEKVGKTYTVLADGHNQEEMLITARLQTQAPQIDGCVILDGMDAEAGEFMSVRITSSSNYDLVAEQS